jgi:hypothetical protein
MICVLYTAWVCGMLGLTRRVCRNVKDVVNNASQDMLSCQYQICDTGHVCMEL